MNLSKNKLIAGVIGLVAIVGVVNTQAIIRLSNQGSSQNAQVINSGTNCIKLSPASSNHTTFIDPVNYSESFDGLSRHMFVIGVKVKNTCNRDVSIIKDSYHFPNGTSSFQVSALEDFPNIQTQTKSTNYSFSGLVPGNIPTIYGIQPPSLIIPESRLTNVPITGDGEMKTTTIPANGEREFVVYSYINANGQGLEHHTRMSLKKLRWFLTQNYNDQNLSSNEVKTYTLSIDESSLFTTSYARFKSQANPSGCAEGTVIGFNKDGSPIYCQ